MSLLGYDPTVYHDGRAPLEAAALGIELDPADWVFRLNLVTIVDGVMQDHSAGHISSAEGERLLAEFTAAALPAAFDGGDAVPGGVVPQPDGGPVAARRRCGTTGAGGTGARW